MTRLLKVATVGAGYFSQFHYDAWSRCPDVQLVGLADQDVTAASSTALKYDIPVFADVADMLAQAQPDLIDIITPPNTHLPLIELAAANGVNVVCQKPFCGDLETAKKAVHSAEQAGIDLIVHENFRFQPWYEIVKKSLDAGLLGQIYQAQFRLRPGDGQGRDAYMDRQPYFQKMERFLVHETAIHFIDVFRYLMGEVTSVWADLEKLNPAIAGEDKCLISLDFGGQGKALLDGNRLSDHRAENQRRTMGELIIEGENGVLTLNGDAVIKFRLHGSSEEKVIDYEWNDHGFGGDCVYRCIRHVVDHYQLSERLMNSGKDYLTNLEIEEAVYHSAQTRRVVDINPV